MIVLGITGAIASGKTTVATMFADAGIPVFSADAVVHQFYLENPQSVIAAFPASEANGVIDRRRLANIVESEPEAIERLEAIIHPVVEDKATAFVAAAEGSGLSIAVLEIPLLLETGFDRRCDKILVTAAPDAIRDERVAARRTMSPELHRRLLGRQTPEQQKLARADYIVHSDADPGEVRRQIGDIIAELKAESARP